jgi:LPS-assembly protein
MNYSRFILNVILILCAVSFPIVIQAKIADLKIAKEEGPVDIEADQLIYDRETQLYQAHGRVKVIRGNFSLKADHGYLNMMTNEMTAWGNVLLREGEDVVECERLEINLETRLGRIEKAKLFLKDQNFHITGQQAEKLGENHYRVRQGSFTTCDAERPPWKFTVKELDVDLQGYGKAKGPVFYLEEIPVLYFPVGLFPMKKERQTGFLLPELGYSSTYGPVVKTAFYWAITKDMDATLYADRLGDQRGRGFKEGLEYRYAFTKDTQGQANLYFVDDQVYGKNRYAFFLQHQQKLPFDVYLKGDINYVSDRFYPQDFDEDLPDKTKIDSWSLKQMRSVLFGGKNWDKFSFIVEGVYFDDLSKEKNDDTVQKLPQVGFYAHPQSLFKTPLFFDLSTTYTNFWRRKGNDAHRWDFLPKISYPVRLFDVVKLEASAGFRETLYRPYNDPAFEKNPWKSRETFEANVEMSTEFYRVYKGTLSPKTSNLFKVAKWMHTIEPMVGYYYKPDVNQDDLPLFDLIDRLPFTSQITYGVTQRLVGKPEKEGIGSGPYEYAKLRIFQSYSLGDPLQTDSKGKSRHFSNIQAEMWLNFNPYLSARWDAEFNPYRGNVDIFNALVRAKDKRNDALWIEYRYNKENIHVINLHTRVRTIDPLYLYGGIRYNILDKWRVENLYGIEYKAQCWTLGVLVEDKNRSPDGTQEKEVKFQVYFNLLGLGSVGHKPSFMNF